MPAAPASVRRHAAAQKAAVPVGEMASTLPHKPSSALKKEGWSGFMREVSIRGGLVVTHHNQPEAVVLSVDSYQALERMAQREKLREEQQLAELSARFDHRLASLNAAQAHDALHAFMDDPVLLDGKVIAGTAY